MSFNGPQSVQVVAVGCLKRKRALKTAVERKYELFFYKNETISVTSSHEILHAASLTLLSSGFVTSVSVQGIRKSFTLFFARLVRFLLRSALAIRSDLIIAG